MAASPSESKDFLSSIFYRFAIPFCTSTAGQVVSGAFLGVKADMQNNPLLSLKQAFKDRYRMNNKSMNAFTGVANIYRGNFWNYMYILICSLTGNNLVQFLKYTTEGLGSALPKAVVGGVAAGFLEASWGARLVARELHRTTSTPLPSLWQTYSKLYLSLALRDSIGWVVVQLGAAMIEKKEEKARAPISPAERAVSVVVTGVAAALISAPADANLRRLYSDNTGRTPAKIFIDSCTQYGFWRATFAGWKGRVAVLSPPFMAYAVAQHYLDKGLAPLDRGSER